VRRVRVDDPMLRLVLLLAVSLSIDALVSEALLYANVYTGARAIAILAAISILGVLPWRRRRASDPPPGPVVVRGLRETPELDRSVPVLMVRIGRYPVFHGAVGAIRTFGQAGVPVYTIVEDEKAPAARSRYVTRSIVWPTTGHEPQEELVAGLAAIGRDLVEEVGCRVVAVPTDDESAVILAEHGDVLREWFLYPHVDPVLPRRLASKRGLNAICRAHDVPTPHAFYPKTRRDYRTYAKRARFPVIVKNVDAFDRIRDKAVPSTTLVPTKAEFLALVAGIENPRSVVFQAYIPNDVAEDWVFHGYFDEHSECLASFTGVKLRSWPPRFGVTTYARIVPNADVAALSARLCKEIGYAGVVDLDWRYDRRTGEYNLVDFNPRVGAQFRLFETDTGLDVLRAMHLHLTGREVPPSTPLYGRGFVVEHLDLPARVAYRGGHALTGRGASTQTVEEGLQVVAGPEIDDGPEPARAWFARDDVRPFVEMVRRSAAMVRARARGARAARKPAPADR
jgi:predicted ATP-grasp superfamily ATP-dependent carboligase